MTLLDQANELPDGDLLRKVLIGLLRSGAPKMLVWGSALHTFWNDAFCTVDPKADSLRRGEAFASLMPTIWRQVREPLCRAMNGVERLNARFHPDLRNGTGLHSYTAYFTPLYGSGGGPKGVLLDVHDTTADRPLSERLLVENRQMQQLFGELPVMMAYGRGKELRLQFVNTAFRKFYGFRPLEGLTVAEAIPEAAEQGFDVILDEVFRSGVSYTGKNTPVRLYSAAGEEIRYLDFIYQPLRAASGEIEGLLCTGVDVTEQQRLAIEGERLKRRALHASRINAMGTMAMTLAHELNQPLSAAGSYLAAARRYLGRSAAADDQGLAMLDLGNTQIRRAGLIIQRAKPLLHTGAATRRKVNLALAVEHAVSVLAASQDFELSVSTDIAPDAAWVMADEIQLEQVLVNLFRNAAQAACDAERREVIVASRSARGDRVRISVRDFGKGLQDLDPNDIFELGRPGRADGLGIGLPLCRTLMEANEGALWAANADGTGAEFFLELDRARADP